MASRRKPLTRRAANHKERNIPISGLHNRFDNLPEDVLLAYVAANHRRMNVVLVGVEKGRFDVVRNDWLPASPLES